MTTETEIEFETIIVQVSPVGECYDAFETLKPRAQAEAANPSMAKMMDIPTPDVLPGETGYAEALAKWERDMAARPANVPVRRYHGRSTAEPGFYVVSGEAKEIARKLLVSNPDGKGGMLPRNGTRWSSVCDTLAEARKAQSEIEEENETKPQAAKVK